LRVTSKALGASGQNDTQGGAKGHGRLCAVLNGGAISVDGFGNPFNILYFAGQVAPDSFQSAFPGISAYLARTALTGRQ
jgi:hypothetical protein